MFAKRNESRSGSPIRVVTSKRVLTALITVAIMTTRGSPYAVAENERGDVFEARNRLVETVRNDGVGALPELQAAITHESEMIRLSAAHLLAALGEPARATLSRNLAHADVHVRYVVIGALERLGVAGEYVKELVTDEHAMIRRLFYLSIMPQHLLVDGAPPDELIVSLESAYDAGSEKIRHEIIKAVAELPLTEFSTALIRRAADQAAAVVAAEGDRADSGHVEKMALVAFLTLRESEIEKMRELADARQWQELVDAFGDRDISSWPDTSGSGRRVRGLGHASVSAEAYYRLGQAYYELGQGEKAEQMLRDLIEQLDLGIGHFLERGFYRRVLSLYSANYQEHLPEHEKVRDRYVQMQFDFGNRLARAGRESEARASYAEVLKVEGLDAGLETEVMAVVAKMKKE